MRRISINIPSYSGTVCVATMASLIPEISALAHRGDDVTVHSEMGSPYICDARGIMVEKFLESDADTFVFIDHDVSWQPTGALIRLIDAPYDMRAGVYPMKKIPLEWPLRWDENKSVLQADPETGFLQVWGVPTGFLVMSRTMLERMVKYYWPLDVAYDDVKRGAYCALFSDYFHCRNDGPPIKMLDDYALCWRWRDIGGEIWIDPEIAFGHTGRQTFYGSLGAWLRGRMEVEVDFNPKRLLIQETA